MTKTKRECIDIFYGDEYATIKAPTNCDYKSLINVICGICDTRGRCDTGTAMSTLASVMRAMSEVMRGQKSVDYESGDSTEVRMIHVDKRSITISFMGYPIKPID